MPSGFPVKTVASGGYPVKEVSSYGWPVQEVPAGVGGFPVTKVTTDNPQAMPVTYIS